MSSLEQLVEEEKNSWSTASYVDCIYGTSKAGQRFAILITQGLWYALRLIIDEDHRQYKRSSSDQLFCNQNWIHRQEFFTKSGVLEKAQLFKEYLEKGKFLEVYEILGKTFALPRLRDMPEDCVKNPDRYLRPGDIIQTNFWLSTNHEGIYIGNGRVIHVSGHGGEKSTSVARVGRLLGDFVSKETDSIRVVVYRIRFQSPDSIVRCAEDWADSRFRAGEYNLLVKNCQHFARLCALGHEECGDLKKVQHFVEAGVLAIFVLLLL
ncbi:hypothetical protein I4U23_013998 [Adineta vaga]|nr:hypothetical protein I4U23_013998 [Adineta vaga]